MKSIILRRFTNYNLTETLFQCDYDFPKFVNNCLFVKMVGKDIHKESLCEY